LTGKIAGFEVVFCWEYYFQSHIQKIKSKRHLFLFEQPIVDLLPPFSTLISMRIPGTTVTEERLRKRGYIPFLEYYLKAKFGEEYRGYAKRK